MIRIQLTLLLISITLFTVAQNFNGFALYNKNGQNTTYLIDESQNIAHTWNLTTECNYAVLLKDNGNIVRGTKNPGNILGGAAEGGRVQEIDPQGNVVWDYIYSTANHLSHHDITLVGDNVLLTAWEVKSQSELLNAGYTGNVSSSGKWPTHFIELQPDGNGGATIVWEWHIWDHLCQDTDPSKPNYVTNISDHPELININMIQNSGGGPSGGGGDWFHVNGVDYNQDLDQIAFSSRFASEIYIIDHSTTSAEAASHSGGNSGMGGDILYRWGNPSNYGMSGQQVIPNAVHDVRWITDDGRPNGGYLQIFNNSGVSNNQSAIDGIETPIDPTTGYTYLRTPGQPYGPSSYSTRYACAYSASGQSASDRMSNGNIFVNASGGQGSSGVMYEVDSMGTIIWGPYPASTAKAFRYECDHPGIIALESYMLSTATTSCFQVTAIHDKEKTNNFSIFPNPTSDKINVSLELIYPEELTINVFNNIGALIYQDYAFGELNKECDLSNYPQGIYFINIISNSGISHTERIILRN
ncbi:MAG: aryl-sulfate sulfotransferase [Bacteroidota bacterium]|nr:aryl-sulfate sulfotransferase [Bacteroidota bacterium]